MPKITARIGQEVCNFNDKNTRFSSRKRSYWVSCTEIDRFRGIGWQLKPKIWNTREANCSQDKDAWLPTWRDHSKNCRQPRQNCREKRENPNSSLASSNQSAIQWSNPNFKLGKPTKTSPKKSSIKKNIPSESNNCSNKTAESASNCRNWLIYWRYKRADSNNCSWSYRPSSTKIRRLFTRSQKGRSLLSITWMLPAWPWSRQPRTSIHGNDNWLI